MMSADRGDQPDDQLRQVIARRRLAAEDEYARLASSNCGSVLSR